MSEPASSRSCSVAIAPLNDKRYHAGNPLAVPISGRQVALLGHLAVVPREKLAPDPIGQVDDLAEVDRVLAIFLGL